MNKNNRNIITIVNRSFVDDNKENHFEDTLFLYKESLANFQDYLLLSKSEYVYKIINSSGSIFHSYNYDIFKFGNINTVKNVHLKSIDRSELLFGNNFDELDGVAYADINNDGYDDILIHPTYQAPNSFTLIQVEFELYLYNDGSYVYTEIDWGGKDPLKRHLARKILVGDFDNDGDPDIAIGNSPGKNFIFLNLKAEIFLKSLSKFILVSIFGLIPEYTGLILFSLHFGQYFLISLYAFFTLL